MSKDGLSHIAYNDFPSQLQYDRTTDSMHKCVRKNLKYNDRFMHSQKQKIIIIIKYHICGIINVQSPVSEQPVLNKPCQQWQSKRPKVKNEKKPTTLLLLQNMYSG